MFCRTAILLAGHNRHLIIKCLKKAINQPRLLLSKTTIKEKIKILQNFEDPNINALFGDYYLKHKKVHIRILRI